ncbi:hypothetical protein WS67_01090 [Burkholderia singularis]|uniref:Uncharacterized protein n=1 Tax=Burkholderia singularis TaxID=1503053 RepID=A0A103DWT3_9BURK|nr:MULTISPECIES: hypothetical protein [Burkholderia]AOK29080.1 hypothetical protein AQ611_06205 [Burkholderia sp. Bp7605]KVE24191.1 hypothetical protein WS67_01090 [Burkholderia singularis]SMF99960.1 hypothetical protein BSIN_3149 [Burkholderia singularis]
MVRNTNSVNTNRDLNPQSNTFNVNDIQSLQQSMAKSTEFQMQTMAMQTAFQKQLAAAQAEADMYKMEAEVTKKSFSDTERVGGQ